MSSIRSLVIVFAALATLAVYFYGPAITPGFRSAAGAACNEHVGGNFRSYRLQWVSWPDTRPHWSCWDAGRPAEPAVSFGWWVDPFG